MRGRAALVLALLAASCGGSSPEARPNVLLITLDTFRLDRMASYGGAAGLTPRLDELARRGTLFEQAVAPMSTTFPSHATLFTGLPPLRHGVRWNGHSLALEQATLAERLSDADYDTGAFVGYKAMLSRGGFRQGFWTVSDMRFSGKEKDVRPGWEVNLLALEWMERERDDPFFAWVHYFEAHAPYPVTPHARERLAGYAGPLAEGAPIEDLYGRSREILAAPADRDALEALYDGQVVELDRLVGELLDALQRSGQLERTLVILTADHGQSLGEHDALGHGYMLWDVALRVPLVIAGPGVEAGRRTPERVGLIDLAPTVLELVGAPAAEDGLGRSLVPALRGGRLEARPYFAEVQRHPKRTAPPPGDAPLAVWIGGAKWTTRDGETALFDLATDPGEERPQGGSADDARRTRFSDLARGYLAQGIADAGGVEELDPEVVEELRSLGYLR